MTMSSVHVILVVVFLVISMVTAQQPFPNYNDISNGNQPGGFASNRQPFNYGPNQGMAYSDYPQTPQMDALYQMSQMAAAHPQTPIAASGARGLGPGGIAEGHPSFQNGYECGKCAKEFKRCELACERGKLTYKCVMCIGVKFDKCHQCWVAPQAMPY